MLLLLLLCYHCLTCKVNSHGHARRVSKPDHTFPGQALIFHVLSKYSLHILLPVTDKCLSWISIREKITVEIILWSNSTKEWCRTSVSSWLPTGHGFYLDSECKFNVSYHQTYYHRCNVIWIPLIGKVLTNKNVNCSWQDTISNNCYIYMRWTKVSVRQFQNNTLKYYLIGEQQEVSINYTHQSLLQEAMLSWEIHVHEIV